MDHKPIRSRVTFSLRLLFVVVLIVAAYFGGWVHGRGDRARSLTSERLEIEEERRQVELRLQKLASDMQHFADMHAAAVRESDSN